MTTPDPGISNAEAISRVAGLDWRLGGQAGINIGSTNSICDVPGIRVGHATRDEPGWLTGVTVVLADSGARAAVDIRGGGPATRETAALNPSGVVEHIHAICLSGGSAYGLGSADGVLEVLAERGLGFRVGSEPNEVVPVVPAASIFDLGRGGSFGHRPGPELGRAAAEAAFAAVPGGAAKQGNVGAGTGAVSGEMRGGAGTASAVLPGGIVVAAFVVVNADGTTVNPVTGVPWGTFAQLLRPNGDSEFDLRTPTPDEHARALQRLGLEAERRPALRPLNTTLAVVATNADLTRAELERLASASHAGMARAIRPVHTLGDGDVVFTMATGGGGLPEPAHGGGDQHQRPDAVNQVLSVGADVLTRAIVHAVIQANTVTTPAGVIPSYRDLYGQ